MTVTAGDIFAIPLSGYLGGDSGWGKTYDWVIEWGDNFGQTVSNTFPGAPQNAVNSAGIPHTYTNTGTYKITIKPNGSTEAWFFQLR